MKLYFAPNSRAVGPRWLLEEIEAPYVLEVIDLEAGQQRTAAYLRINPNGHVPALVDDELVLIEAPAITMYIADKFIEKGFAPALGSNLRPLYYQWMFYAASLERHIKRFSMLSASPELDQDLERRRSESQWELAISAKVISDHLKDRPFILGNQFSAADIALFHWLWELEHVYNLVEDHPEISAYLDLLEARPARQRGMTLDSGLSQEQGAPRTHPKSGDRQ